MRRAVTITLVAVGVVFVGIQFVPVRRSHRAGTGDPTASREVRWILRRACYDCHPDARLSDSDLTALQRWSDGAATAGP